MTVDPTAIDSEEEFGLPTIFGRGTDLLILPSAISTLEAFGTMAISDAGTPTIHPVGIPAP